jgi:hypothetical protein
MDSKKDSEDLYFQFEHVLLHYGKEKIGSVNQAKPKSKAKAKS